jgi:hypothetical protein
MSQSAYLCPVHLKISQSVKSWSTCKYLPTICLCELNWNTLIEFDRPDIC